MLKSLKSFFVFFLLIFSPAIGQVVISEVIGIKAKEDQILIDVAKKYPEVKFFQVKNPPKILIELLNTRYHNNFTFDESIKENLLSNLTFANNISVEDIKYDNEKEKVAITIDLKNNISLATKIASTKDNTVTVSFPQPLKLEDVDPQEITKLYNNAIEEHSKNNLDQAEKLYLEVLSYDKKFYLAEFNLAKLYTDKKMYDEAITMLVALLQDIKSQLNDAKKDESLVFIYNTLGNVYLLKDELKQAKEQFEEALKINPNSYLANYNLGLVYEREKELNNAKLFFQKAIKLNTGFVEGYYHIGVLDLINNHKKDAINGFKKVVELAPNTKIAELSQNELYKLKKKFFSRAK